MKVGSLVEYTGLGTPRQSFRAPIKGEVYTVRELFPSDLDGTMLLKIEEFSFGVCGCGCKKEIGATAKYFREVQPPMDLTKLIEQTEQLTLTH